jgi:hypothetical protein
VPTTAQTGTITATMFNGETVVFQSITVNPPLFCFIPELPGADVEIRAGNLLTVEVQNEDKLTAVQVGNANTQYILQGSTLYVLIPNNAGGNTTLTLVSSNGQVSYQINVIGTSIIETIIYQGPTDIGDSWNVSFSVPKTTFTGVAAGSKLKIYYTTTAANAQIKINNDNWTAIQFPDAPIFDSSTGVITLPENETSYEFVLTSAILNEILTLHSSWNSPDGIIIAGQNAIIAKVSLITQGAAVAPETVVYEGTYELGWGITELTLNKDVFEGVAAGAVMKFYYTSSGNAQIKFHDATWGTIDISHDPNVSATDNAVLELPSGETSYGITLTASMLNTILTVTDGWGSPAGLLFKGQEGTLSKITIK